jgi:NADH-quinone oxidoreductase subunit M
MLSLLILLPIVVALILLAVPSHNTKLFRWASLLVSILQLIVAGVLALQYQVDPTGYQFMEQQAWIDLSLGSLSRFQAFYAVGVDGLSLPLVLLTALIMAVATGSAWHVHKQVKGFFVLLLVLNGAIMGSFVALDALLFFVFFEFMLIPMYFLIGIWGGPRREYASVKFILYTLLGSIFILIAFILLYSSVQLPDAGTHTFLITMLRDAKNYIPGGLLDINSTATFMGGSGRAWTFLLLFIGFAIKLPAVPFHTWLPDAHVEAPTPVSIVLAALLLKVGGYGLIRFAFGLLPDQAQAFSLFTSSLAVISIIYAALNALASNDLKRMIAYSSISHMGFVLLGAASATVEGIAGSAYQMVSHGIITAMLFALAGVLYDRTGDRTIGNYSGLYVVMPRFTLMIMIGFFAAMGIPGFSAFIGELMVYLGAFESPLLSAWVPVIAALGIILTAGYFVWTMQRMLFGPLVIKGQTALADLTPREIVILAVLAVLTLLLGIFPQLLMHYINPFAAQLADGFAQSIR